ncbi:uncharacterized protein A1O5_12797 [Cladophialophora psammophila CBS 110553]|uniref:Major facilitator superfamily (MFS) profile domain-containing protein n=1 Tax=Cladophialophora psammophila CBS 110553 TaxID=1182543 RepID=W9VHU1_9EURO|nr:uncharacterized protein A1O5_12797 [Cladophialophora psammophila CBS 110553]EXJ55058.1 hypothetical protein A1O5_12797 [Cladophialophora psammophila CBS 110553]
MASLSLYNIYIYTVLGFGGFTYGFGFSVFVAAEGQPGFYSYFNLDPTSKHTASIIDTVNALFTVGAAFGSVAQSFVADKWGRKIGLAVSAMYALIGGALAAGAISIPMLVVVRLLQGFGLGMVLPLVPLYLSEITPPHQQGLLSGLPLLSFGTGYLV